MSQRELPVRERKGGANERKRETLVRQRER